MGIQEQPCTLADCSASLHQYIVMCSRSHVTGAASDPSPLQGKHTSHHQRRPSKQSEVFFLYHAESLMMLLDPCMLQKTCWTVDNLQT